MFTPVKLGLIATATAAAVVPASIALIDRSEIERILTAPRSVVTTTIPSTQIRPDDFAAIAPGPTGAGAPGRSQAEADTGAAAVPPPSAEAIAARVSAGFEMVAATPAAAAAVQPGPVMVGGKAVLPPAPLVATGIAPDLPPGVPRVPPVPALDAPADPIVVASVEPPEAAEAGVRIDVSDVPVPKPAPRDAKAEADGVAETYRKLVAREAEALKMPAKVAEAFVEVESGFDAGRKGDDGRIGLTQINLRIARQYGFKGSEKELADPETNVRWGLKYLAGAYRKAGGDVCRTSAKFLGGHTVDKPTAEHKAYCTKVKQAMASL